MLRPRRESLHSDGITDQKSLQRTSATKSALKRRYATLVIGPLSGGKADAPAISPDVAF